VLLGQPLDDGDEIAEAAHAAWIACLAGAAAGGDVRADAFDGAAPTVLAQLGANARLGFVEAGRLTG
jgi:hypothetical protein